jgi:MFS family permease
MAKTSTWLALRNPTFRRLWFATVISGSCIAAHNTAVFWALNSLGATTVLISLMATVSALPGTLFTLPADAIADMVDRKKIFGGVQLWQASIAIAVTILWTVHLLNPYLILASAFLFSLGWPGTRCSRFLLLSMVMVAQAATALGGVIWGLAANSAGIVPTFLGAAGFCLLIMTIVRVVPSLQISIDFTKSLSFESAPVSIFAQSLDPGRLPAPQDGPVSITAEFQVAPTRRNECIELMRDARLIFLRNGASRWHLYEDLKQPNKFRMEVVVPSWKQHLLQRERMTKNEKDILLKLRSLRTDPNPPEEWISLSVEKEVLNKTVRAGGLPRNHSRAS